MIPHETRSYLGLGLLVHALQSSVDPVEIDDLQRSIVFVNNAWCELFGRDRRQVSGTRWDRLQLDGGDSMELRASWARCLADGRAEGTFRLQRSGLPGTMVSYSRSLYRDVDGAPTATITIYRPLPEGQTYDEPQPNLLAEVLEENSDGIAVLGANGDILEANQAFCSMVGTRKIEIRTAPIGIFIPEAYSALSTAAEGAEPWHGHAELVREEGEAIPVSLRIGPLRDNAGTLMGFMVRAKTPAKDDGAIGSGSRPPMTGFEALEHKLRNVLTVIIGNVGLLEGSVSDAEVRRRLDLIGRAARNGLDVLSDGDTQST